ncbi:glycine zipper 2TM domain-containing protein [Sphingomonas morindae]|uniref:Glycine zipper 2TM domain-containing protein n=1 Tax=Sphingomonas morindae TaxID=1541170 RepID=A0ABY4XAA8_9SPHN|nr:glycine zipper 2TM domain-containing protein [Sphingomonas morindae]USI73616.1 glycine zipper 2TM domain-containing protein [Sphingomonas morindae]
MKIKLALAAFTAVTLVPAALPSAAMAQDYDRRHYRDDREYRGRDGRYAVDCKRSSGTTGTIAGGVGGAVLGNVLGGGTLGTLAGAGGGALLGRHLDKKHDAAQNRRNGC